MRDGEGLGHEEGGGCEDDMKGNFGLGGLRSGWELGEGR